MICPDCQGSKQAIHTIRAGEFASVHGWYKCARCAGTGVVTPELDRWWEAGHALRDRRIARRESVRQAAAGLGISVAHLCDIENGRVDFDKLPSMAPALRTEP